MTRMLTIIALLFATPMLASCVTELEVASYAPIENPTKRILAPAGIGKNITKFMKRYFRKNGWVVVVETKTTKETRSSGKDRKLEKTLYDAPYRMFVDENWRPDYCANGDDYVSFSLSIVTAETGEEVFVADGSGCIGQVEKELSPKLNAVFLRGEMLQEDGQESVIIPLGRTRDKRPFRRGFGVGG
jgi:hypothetical protein